MVQTNPIFFLRSPQTASRAFGTGNPGQPMSAVPRTKFEFYVQFVLSSGANSMLANANLNTYEGNRGLTFKVKTADKPKIKAHWQHGSTTLHITLLIVVGTGPTHNRIICSLLWSLNLILAQGGDFSHC